MTPGKLTKMAGMTVVQLVKLSNTPKQTLYDIFKRDRLRFEEILIQAMRQQCIDDVLARKLRLHNEISDILRAGDDSGSNPESN